MADTQQSIGELPPFEHSPEVSIERESPVESPQSNALKKIVQVSEVAIPVTVQTPATPSILDEKSQMRRDIERILEADLGDIYLTLNAKQRGQFRIEGERAAAKIELLLQQAKIKLITIITIIRQWLQLLPGVNKFFLEQEAKIKAEKLLILKTADEQ